MEPTSDQQLDEIRSERKNDDTLKTVTQYVQNGWQKRNKESTGQQLRTEVNAATSPSTAGYS